ncbi:MAG: hypothetical protein Fues2KO_54660 [Fuerstiella sp.]
MIILLLGPSGVGKTTSYELIADEVPQCECRHLDGLASRWGVAQGWLKKESVGLLRSHIDDNQLFLAFGLEAIGAFAADHHDRHCVIDVGAGFQDARSAKYLSRIHRTIALTGDAHAIYQRKLDHRGEDRSFEEYFAVEFSEHRRSVYNACQHTIDTTHQSKDETADQLKATLQQILSAEGKAG